MNDNEKLRTNRENILCSHFQCILLHFEVEMELIWKGAIGDEEIVTLSIFDVRRKGDEIIHFRSQISTLKPIAPLSQTVTGRRGVRSFAWTDTRSNLDVHI